ncbi:MAG: 4Fe-4S binding protein [Candidatus Krumholzibacteriota bacterium]|nr:4Fe-4S binding protein [Candidatus Krumholzibacteriota bacterium]
MKRQIITIDEEKCNGCGKCLPNCPEGALQIIDGKARLVSDLFCDGLGACIGYCPEGAISTELREAEKYDEKKVMENIIRQGPNVLKAHLKHLVDHGETDLVVQAVEYLKDNDHEIPEEAIALLCPASRISPKGNGPVSGCPGSSVVEMKSPGLQEEKGYLPPSKSMLDHWPVQIKLVPSSAPFLDGSDLVIVADCVPFAYADFHERFLKGRSCIVGCPKLDDAGYYLEKLTAIFSSNDIRSILIAYMEVPCCSGMVRLVERALEASGKEIPVSRQMIGIKGDELPR